MFSHLIHSRGHLNIDATFIPLSPSLSLCCLLYIYLSIIYLLYSQPSSLFIPLLCTLFCFFLFVPRDLEPHRALLVDQSEAAWEQKLRVWSIIHLSSINHLVFHEVGTTTARWGKGLVWDVEQDVRKQGHTHTLTNPSSVQTWAGLYIYIYTFLRPEKVHRSYFPPCRFKKGKKY